MRFPALTGTTFDLLSPEEQVRLDRAMLTSDLGADPTHERLATGSGICRSEA